MDRAYVIPCAYDVQCTIDTFIIPLYTFFDLLANFPFKESGLEFIVIFLILFFPCRAVIDKAIQKRYFTMFYSWGFPCLKV